MAAMRTVVNVEGAIVQGGRFLMIIRGAEETHAAGTLSFPGGKFDSAGLMEQVLEATLDREVQEEVGITVHDDMEYVHSTFFVSDDGEPVVNVVFLCRYHSGIPTIIDHGEVADLRWMSAEEVNHHPAVPPWTRKAIELAERKRIVKAW
jgi:8-oxo-dGTP diphosphatase